jgi:hypothetical protein
MPEFGANIIGDGYFSTWKHTLECGVVDIILPSDSHTIVLKKSCQDRYACSLKMYAAHTTWFIKLRQPTFI